MIVIGSDFSGVVPFLCIALLACMLGAISFYPAWRGHWSALVLIAPLLIIGVLWARDLYANVSMVGPAGFAFLSAPLIVAATSIGLWFARMWSRGQRAERAGFAPVFPKK